MKKNLICIIISLFIALILIALKDNPLYHIIELKLYDVRMNLRKEIPQDPRILYVEMDDHALNSLGRWPWPRTTIAHIIDTLESLGAEHIIFDITFANPSQLIIKSQDLNKLIDTEKPISNFIEQVSQGIKSSAINDKNEISGYLDQIHGGVKQFKDNIQNSLSDSDITLEKTLKDKKVYLGCKFEVIYDKRDIQRDKDYPVLKNKLLTWLKGNPDKTFNDLPFDIKRSTSFSSTEVKKIFFRQKIYLLLQEDIFADIEKAKKELKGELQDIRAHFNSVKEIVIKETITSFINKNPEASFKEIVWEYEVHDPDNLEIFKKSWEDIISEKEFRENFGIKFDNKEIFFKAINVETPILPFTKAVNNIGFLNGIPDIDGALRSIPMFVQYRNKIYPHMGIASTLDYLNPGDIKLVSNNTLLLKDAQKDGKQKDIYVPLSKEGKMLINWAGKWKNTFNHISCADVYRVYALRENLSYNLTLPKDALSPEQQKILQDDIKRLAESEEKLKQKISDKICIIGLTAAGTHDYNPMPYEETYPMVGTHGNVINSILTETFITKTPDKYNIAVLILLALIMGTLLSILPSIGGLFVVMLILTAIFILSLHLFNQGIWIDMASPFLLSLLSYLGITSYKFSSEEKEKRWVKKAFSQYVSKDVMDEILEDPSKLTLGGERRIISVLFSDIRSFTTYSENRKPEEIVSILNEYLDAMTKIIFKNRGTLDKYVGDEIMAIYGAPHVEDPAVSAKNAVITACEMMDELHKLQEKWKNEGKDPLDIGVGVNTGEMVVGNMGSTLRMDYTVIGDAVNLGARVEALTRNYNNHIMISEFTYEYVKDIVEVKQLEAIKVKGKDIPVMMYEVLNKKK